MGTLCTFCAHEQKRIVNIILYVPFVPKWFGPFKP